MTNATTHRQRFRRSGMNRVVPCRCCGMLTHSTIDGQVDLCLCRVCNDHALQENSHVDNCPDQSVPFEQCDQGCDGREICRRHAAHHESKGVAK